MVSRTTRHALIVCAIIAVPGASRAEGVTWGVAAGHPHVLAVVLETPQQSMGRLQMSLSPLIFVNSLTARVMVSPLSTRVRPYLFLGGGIYNTNESNGSSGVGTTGFIWGGGGLRIRFGRLDVFTEFGGMDGMDEDKGFEEEVSSFALGILFLPASTQ